MTNRDRLESAAIGGITGLLIVAVYIVLRGWQSDVKPGEWLNFAGVIFGVAATVGGTIGLDSLRKSIARRQALGELIRALNMFVRSSDNARTEPSKAEEWGRGIRMQARYISLQLAKNGGDYVLLAMLGEKFDELWNKHGEEVQVDLKFGAFPDKLDMLCKLLADGATIARNIRDHPAPTDD